MKKRIITLISLPLALTQYAVHASNEIADIDRHTISIAFAQTTHNMDKPKNIYGVPGYNNAADGLDKLKGVNLKYRYEIDSTFGLIASWTHSHVGQNISVGRMTNNIGDITYNSLMIGPTFRLNHWASAYVTVGRAWSNYSAIVVDRDLLSKNNGYYSSNEKALAYSIGLQFNPVKNIAIDLAFESANMGVFNEVNTVMVGAGWNF